IFMYRIGQLETKSAESMFKGERQPKLIAVPIRERIGESRDPRAPAPALQRMLSQIRTDFDGFSRAEISGLVRHGYCVARKQIQDNQIIERDADFWTQKPWDPTLVAKDVSVVICPKETDSRTRKEEGVSPKVRRLRNGAISLASRLRKLCSRL